jgi:outer membrane lipoprotein-sorting protein
MATRLRVLRAALLALVGLCFVAPAAQAAPAAPAAGVASRLANPAVLRGAFEQEKRLKGFRNPLLSKGDFLMAKDRGVVWSTRTPFASTLVLTRQKLQLKQADGSTRNLGGGEASPAVATTNTLLMALLSGDTQALSRQFLLHESIAADGSWKLELQPKQGALKKLFARIELQGDQYVRSVHLEEVRGDVTDIRFLQLRTTPATLAADEAKSFD